MSAVAAMLSLKQTIAALQREDVRAFLCRRVDGVICFLEENKAALLPEVERDITQATYHSLYFIDNLFLDYRSRYYSVFTLYFYLYSIGLCGFCLWSYQDLECCHILISPIMAVKIATDISLLDRMLLYSFRDILILISGACQTLEDHCDPARAAMNTLLGKLNFIFSSRHKLQISESEIAQLESLYEMASSLLVFMRNASLNKTDLQAITDAALKARYALLHYPSTKLTPQYLLAVNYAWWSRVYNELISHKIYLTLHKMLIGDFNLPQEICVCFLLLLQLVLDFYSLSCTVVEKIKYLQEQLFSVNSKHQAALFQAIDDFSKVMKDVTKNKDVFGSQSELHAASSKPHLGGRAAVVVGLENDMMKIKSRVLQNWSKREIVSIVGMGGIGKTTLATQVYNDPDILRHFYIQAWVKVSQEYSLRRVLLSLLESLLSQLEPDSAMKLRREMQKHDDPEFGVDLYKILWGRRYLIVMDDVWDTQILDFMSTCYPENSNGSCVLLTSRISEVASYLDSSSPLHQMQCLNEDDSWYLLHQLVFGAEGYPFELGTFGREIARGCRGLPLAISVVGGFISKNNRIEIWKKVAEEFRHSESREIKEILGLSYTHLPLQLRPCFLYMGVFSGDYEIPISRLINLWGAEGFLGPHPSENMEELGEQNLKALIDRNLILVSKRSCNGKIKTCSIHDILRDFCVLIAKEENFFHVVESQGYGTRGRPNETACRISIHPDALHIDSRNDLMSSYHYLRSLHCISGRPITDRNIGLYLDFMHLRVLDVVAVQFDEFPHQIIKLRFLRYLAIHYDGPFPASISKFMNLQTLVHHHKLFGKYLLYPVVIWSTPNLRHLIVKPGYDLSQFLWGLGFLVHLQTLVGARNLKWSQSVVQRIKNLKKLVISYDVPSSVAWSKYQLECLVELHQLESLKIIMKSAISNVPPKLAFPEKLKKLSLSGCGIPWAEMAVIGALPNLEALKLRSDAFCGPSWVTVEGQFPQLTFLLVEEMSFSSWETDEAHFPRLQRLVIKSCGSLEKFPPCVGDIPTLEKIELINCHPSAEESAREMQEEQESMGNVDLILHILSWGSGDEQ